MRKSLLILAAILGSASLSKAAFISFVTGGARGHQFLLSDGATRVATGGLPVKVGYLTTPGDSSTFVEFATTVISNPLSTAPIGGFINTKTGDNPNVAGIRNKQVAIWVYGQNGDQGLFTSSAWTVPGTLAPDVDASYDVVLGITQGGANPPAVTAVTLPGQVTAARYQQPVSITVTTGTNVDGASYVLASFIPEPSSMGLLALAGLATLRRRR